MATSNHNRKLEVDFSWRKFEALVFEKDGDKSKPLYVMDYKLFKIKNNLIFHDAISKETIGTGTLHPISIHADCVIRGEKVKLEALKRLTTHYTHLSHVFSDSKTPVQMEWKTNIDLKTWDFICLDQNQQPVCKFAANIWMVKKMGYFEFLGEKAMMNEAAREELMIMGLTLFNLMMLRTNNIFQLFGAAFTKTGKIENGAQGGGVELEQHRVADPDGKPAIH